MRVAFSKKVLITTCLHARLTNNQILKAAAERNADQFLIHAFENGLNLSTARFLIPLLDAGRNLCDQFRTPEDRQLTGLIVKYGFILALFYERTVHLCVCRESDVRLPRVTERCRACQSYEQARNQ